MLKTIRRFDRKAREGLLADLALSIGKPVIGADPVSKTEIDYQPERVRDIFAALIDQGPRGEVQREILSEIIGRLNLNQSQFLYEGKTRVLEFLGKEIKGLAVESTQIISVRKRLGQKGMLPPKGYRIKFAPEYADLCKTMGISNDEVRQVISDPDMFEHFIPEVESPKFEAISLYAKSFLATSDAYSLLVDTRREGDSITVHYAVRVFHSDVDVSAIAKPTDLLHSFADKFGEEIVVNNLSGKLLLFTSMRDGSDEFKVSLQMSPDRGPIDIRASHRLLEGNVREVAMAYGVNVRRYAESLRQHGVHVTRKIE